jgi:hypothetical protein
MESKGGDFMSQMDDFGQGNFPNSQTTQPKAAPKKTSVATDAKKKWMRRI